MSASAVAAPARPVGAAVSGDGTAAKPARFGVPWYVMGLMGLAFAVRLAFWLYTDRVWEDALITLAPVRNAFTAIGLTHHGGEGHVYSFTSALSVLIPLAGEAIHRGSGLFSLRLVSLLCGPAAVFFTWRICRRLGISAWPSVFALAYVAADHEQVFFGMAGMETQVATTILLGSVYAVMTDEDLWIGIGFGLSLLVRPDFALWVVPAAIYLAWRRGPGLAVRAAALATAVYGPWLLFTQLYYGSVIPQTIRAKAVVFSPLRFGLGHGAPGLTDWLATVVHVFAIDVGMFAPFYDNNATDRAPLPVFVALFISVFTMVLVIQGASRTRAAPGWLPAIWYVVLFLLYRVFLLGVAGFGWYMPPFRALLAILAAAGLMRMREAFPRLAPVYAGVTAALFTVATFMLIPVDRKVQEIENAVRISVGHYLGEHAPGETVVSESSGYVGYYSSSRLYDFPGLTSPTSFHTLADAPPQDRSLLYLVVALKPQWIVMRPVELQALRERYPEVGAQYTVAAHYRSDLAIAALGISESSIDRDFYVLRRS